MHLLLKETVQTTIQSLQRCLYQFGGPGKFTFFSISLILAKCADLVSSLIRVGMLDDKVIACAIQGLRGALEYDPVRLTSPIMRLVMHATHMSFGIQPCNLDEVSLDSIIYVSSCAQKQTTMSVTHWTAVLGSIGKVAVCNISVYV